MIYSFVQALAPGQKMIPERFPNPGRQRLRQGLLTGGVRRVPVAGFVVPVNLDVQAKDTPSPKLQRPDPLKEPGLGGFHHHLLIEGKDTHRWRRQGKPGLPALAYLPVQARSQASKGISQVLVEREGWIQFKPAGEFEVIATVDMAVDFQEKPYRVRQGVSLVSQAEAPELRGGGPRGSLFRSTSGLRPSATRRAAPSRADRMVANSLV